MRRCLFLALLVLGCGGPSGPPKHGIIESSIGGWAFRREQRLQDVEVWVKDNPAQSYSASYVSKRAENRGQIGEDDVVNAVVTRYKGREGVRGALIRFARRIGNQSGYRVTESEQGDVQLLVIKSPREYWVFWSAPGHVVKLGGPGRGSVPEDVVEAYGARYRSTLKSGDLERYVE